jgi:hypothetical protein
VAQRHSDESFFHRKHVVTLFWAIVAALLTFVGTTIYQAVQGPQEVYITNPDTVIRVITIRDSATSESIRQMLDELHHLRGSSRESADNTGAGPGGRFTPIGGKQQDTQSIAEVQVSSETSDPAPEMTVVATPGYRFPMGNKGIHIVDIGGIARSSCPQRSFSPREDVPLSIILRSGELVRAVTPLFLSVTKGLGPRQSLAIFGQQYQPRWHSIVVFPAPTEPGTYSLNYGYYLLSDSLAEYPELYNLNCRLVVE